MEPNDTMLGPYVAMPGWMRALQQAVGDANFAIPGAALTPMTALQEIISLRDSTAPETREDRASLQRDLGAALDGFGDELEAEVRTSIEDFRRTTLPRVPELMQTREGMEVASASAELLVDRITADAAMKAAWRDVVSAFRNHMAYDICLRRIAVVRELVGARGHAWVTEAERIAQIINDNAEQAAMAWGSDSERIRSGQNDDGTAGLDGLERLALIEADLVRPAGEEEISVWLLISDAVVNEGMIQCGTVQFFDARFLRSRLGERPIDPRPFGLSWPRAGYLASQMLASVADDEQAVFVRVPARGSKANAVAWAREIVAGLLDVATLGRPRPGWNLESGYVVVNQDGGWSLQRFRHKDPFERYRHRPDRDLSRIDEDLANAWIEGTSAAGEAVELARWDKALDMSSNEGFRVALGVRNLERVLPGARVESRGGRNMHWREVASHYLKETWCWRVLQRELKAALYYAATPSNEASFDLDDDRDDTFFERFKEIVDPSTFSEADLVRHASTIGALFDPGSSRGRLVNSIAARTSTPIGTLSWLNDLGADFDVLLARAARQRNATVHGSATVPSIISGLLPFVADLGKQVVETALAAAANGRPRISAFESARMESMERTARLAEGSHLAEVL